MIAILSVIADDDTDARCEHILTFHFTCQEECFIEGGTLTRNSKLHSLLRLTILMVITKQFAGLICSQYHVNHYMLIKTNHCHCLTSPHTLS